MSAGYSGTPLSKKLGIKSGMAVALIDPPEGIDATLGVLPEGASLHVEPDAACPMTIWFVRGRGALEAGLDAMLRRVGADGLWLAWPKKSSGLAKDISEDTLREVILPTGLVDIKVCAIDATWSGLRFAWRRNDSS